jgi:Family of unknown function (DUF6527)
MNRLEALTPRFVPDVIDRPLEHGVVYISEKFDLAIHLCACGCEQETVMPINRRSYPGERGWDFTKHEDGSVSFSPSVGNMGFCPNRAHYYIERNRIRWC